MMGDSMEPCVDSSGERDLLVPGGTQVEKNEEYTLTVDPIRDFRMWVRVGWSNVLKAAERLSKLGKHELSSSVVSAQDDV